MSYGDPNTPALPPPGWYADPANPALERWWAGPSWTDHVREIPRAVYAPPAPQPYQPMGGWNPGVQPYTQQTGFTVEGTSPNTVPIWLLATALPLVSIAGNLLRLISASLGFGFPPAAVTGAVIGFGFAAAVADHRALLQRGLPAPSWAWILLTPIGYFIARRIALKSVGVRNDAPGNVFAGIFLLMIVGGVAVGIAFATR